MTNPAGSAASSRIRTIVYWVTTVIIAAELAVGGVWDILRTDYVREVLEQQLSYPPYVAVIIGVWKVPGAVALLVPRFPGSRNGPTPARSSPTPERPPPTWRWVMAPARWARSASPSSRSPPGLCVRRLAATSRREAAHAPGFSLDHSQIGRALQAPAARAGWRRRRVPR